MSKSNIQKLADLMIKSGITVTEVTERTREYDAMVDTDQDIHVNEVSPGKFVVLSGYGLDEEFEQEVTISKVVELFNQRVATNKIAV